jgi:Domain of unknown function (DU1801)
MATTMQSIEEYLRSLPAERQAAMSSVRRVILDNLPEGYAEQMQGGMIGYVVPHELYPAGYHCDPQQPLQYAALASEKSYMSLHLMTVYGDPVTAAWFRKAYEASGKRLDMGKACVRFKKVEDLPLEVIGQAIARTPAKAYIARVEKFRESREGNRGK